MGASSAGRGRHRREGEGRAGAGRRRGREGKQNGGRESSRGDERRAGRGSEVSFAMNSKMSSESVARQRETTYPPRISLPPAHHRPVPPYHPTPQLLTVCLRRRIPGVRWGVAGGCRLMRSAPMVLAARGAKRRNKEAGFDKTQEGRTALDGFQSPTRKNHSDRLRWGHHKHTSSDDGRGRYMGRGRAAAASTGEGKRWEDGRVRREKGERGRTKRFKSISRFPVSRWLFFLGDTQSLRQVPVPSALPLS